MATLKNGEEKLITDLTAEQVARILQTIPASKEAKVIGCKPVLKGYQIFMEGGVALFSETPASRGDIALLGEARMGDIVKINADKVFVYNNNVTKLVFVAAASSEERMAQAMQQYKVQFAVANVAAAKEA